MHSRKNVAKWRTDRASPFHYQLDKNQLFNGFLPLTILAIYDGLRRGGASILSTILHSIIMLSFAVAFALLMIRVSGIVAGPWEAARVSNFPSTLLLSSYTLT